MTTRDVPTSTRHRNGHPTYTVTTSSNVALVVAIVAIVSANVVGSAVGSGGVCPPSCRCTERNAVVTCSSLVHVPPIPSIAIRLDLDHNRISLLLNTSLRGAETSVSGGGSWTTLRRLEVLSIEDNGLLYIEVGALSTLYELRELRLGRNHLSTLPRDLLAANRKLRVLDLHANYLASIPDGVIRLAHGLVVLNVSFNHLTSVRLGDGFRHVSQLSVIDLSGNDVPTIEADTFEVMQWWDDETPRHINLSYCNVRHIRPAAFRSVPRLVTLNLDGNPRLPQEQIESALAGIRNQPALEVVRLSHCNVTDTLTLVRQLQSATNLTRLELSHNRIRSVGKRTFFFLSSLRRLNLGHNEISSIEGIGGGLARLEHLDLSFNCLERLDASTFEGLHELRVLDVSHNSLTGDFDAEPLLGLFNLHTVDVGHNRIRSFRIDDGGLESLETLSAAWNRIFDLSFIRRLPHLRTLDLSHNVIERVPDDLLTARSSGLAAVDRVNLSGNSIVDVAYGAFRHSSINVIDLSYNRLATLSNYGWKSSPPSSTGQQSTGGGVRVLIVNDNFIANISEDAFDGLEMSLVELRLERNSLGRLPAALSPVRLPRLRLLDLGWNPIGRFLETPPSSAAVSGTTSGSSTRLETLRLNDVGLTSWPSTVIGGAELRTVDLAGNRIRSVPDDALNGLGRLKRIDLSRNRFQMFDPLRSGLPDVTPSDGGDVDSAVVVDLSDNPLDCGCSMEPLCRYLFPASTVVGEDGEDDVDVDGESAARHRHGRRRHRGMQTPQALHVNRTLRCRTPAEWNGVPLKEFCADMVQCSSLTTAVAAGAAGLLCIVVVLLVAIVCCRRVRSRGGIVGHSASTPVKTGSIYAAAAVGGKARSRCRMDSYQFVVDETTLTSSSNASSASSNTTTTSGCDGLLASSPLVHPVGGSVTFKLPVSSTSDGGNLQANLLMNKQWL